MTEHGTGIASADRWYARPVLFVADLNRSLRFYLDQLGFVKNWHAGDGAGTVCQVSRSDCEISSSVRTSDAETGRASSSN